MRERAPRKHRVRRYRTSDREAIRRICCDTGFLGQPIDPVFEDRELFADYLTRYYTDFEPDSVFVMEKDGEVRGFATGCRHLARYHWFHLWHGAWIAIRGLSRWFAWPYRESTRHYIRWALTRAGSEVPEAPDDLPHFHFNILSDARGQAESHDLLQALLDHFAACGERKAWAQVVAFETRRSERVFQRFGFEIRNRGEITKFREVHPEAVYLYTIVKDLDQDLYVGSVSDRKFL